MCIRDRNKTAGLVLGFAEGVVLVWIFFLVITVCASTQAGGQLLKMTAQSSILSLALIHIFVLKYEPS